MIPRKLIEEMFANCKKAKVFDESGACLWSYFFTDTDADKLLAAGEALEQQGFTLIGVTEAEDAPEESDDQYFFLQVDRVERHTIETLVKRNEELAAYAEERELHSYDGMEASPLDSDVEQ